MDILRGLYLDSFCAVIDIMFDFLPFSLYFGILFFPLALPFIIGLFVVRFRTIEVTDKFLMIKSFTTTMIPRKSIESVQLNSGKQIKITMTGGKKETLSWLKDPEALLILLSE